MFLVPHHASVHWVTRVADESFVQYSGYFVYQWSRAACIDDGEARNLWDGSTFKKPHAMGNDLDRSSGFCWVSRKSRTWTNIEGDSEACRFLFVCSKQSFRLLVISNTHFKKNDDVVIINGGQMRKVFVEDQHLFPGWNCWAKDHISPLWKSIGRYIPVDVEIIRLSGDRWYEVWQLFCLILIAKGQSIPRRESIVRQINHEGVNVRISFSHIRSGIYINAVDAHERMSKSKVGF